MTEPAPDTAAHRAQAQRDAAIEALRSKGADIAAVLITHPRLRTRMLAGMAMSPDDEAMTLLLLAVVDELTLDRDTDVIMQPVTARAAAAMAVVEVPDTVADLLGDTT